MTPKDRKEFTTDEVKEFVARLKNRKTTGADEKVNEFLEYGGETMATMIILRYNAVEGIAHTPKG